MSDFRVDAMVRYLRREGIVFVSRHTVEDEDFWIDAEGMLTELVEAADLVLAPADGRKADDEQWINFWLRGDDPLAARVPLPPNPTKEP